MTIWRHVGAARGSMLRYVYTSPEMSGHGLMGLRDQLSYYMRPFLSISGHLYDKYTRKLTVFRTKIVHNS